MQVVIIGMRMSKHRLLFISVSAFSVLLAFITLVNPRDKNIAYIFVPVVLFWIFITSLLLYVANKALKSYSIFSKSLVFSLSSVSVLLLLMSGIDQLSLGDVLLSTSLGVIVIFYFYRTWA